MALTGHLHTDKALSWSLQHIIAIEGVLLPLLYEIRAALVAVQARSLRQSFLVAAL
jgi:hypothetical protein